MWAALCYCSWATARLVFFSETYKVGKSDLESRPAAFTDLPRPESDESSCHFASDSRLGIGSLGNVLPVFASAGWPEGSHSFRCDGNTVTEGFTLLVKSLDTSSHTIFFFYLYNFLQCRLLLKASTI